MQFRARRFCAGLSAFACLAALAGALPADAESKQKSKQARGMFVGFDAETKTVTVKERGKEIVYNVTPEGSVLTRTTVKINGNPSNVRDLPRGAPVIVYWRPDQKTKGERYARMIDAPRVPPDLLKELEKQQGN